MRGGQHMRRLVASFAPPWSDKQFLRGKSTFVNESKLSGAFFFGTQTLCMSVSVTNAYGMSLKVPF